MKNAKPETKQNKYPYAQFKISKLFVGTVIILVLVILIFCNLLTCC